MTRAYWTVVAVHALGNITHLGRPATSWAAANAIADNWRRTYRCPVYLVRAA